MNRRWLLVGALLAFAAGVAFVLLPAGAPRLPRLLVPVVGLLALVQALRSLRTRWRTPVRWTDTPDPELPLAVPPPGEDLDDALAPFLGTERVVGRTPTRDGLRRAAVAVLVRYRGLTETEAEDRIEAGTWTDDAVAAAFLSGTDPPNRLRDALPGASAFSRGVERTAAAVADVAGLSVPDGDDDPVPPERTVDVPDEGFETRLTGRWVGASVLALVGVGAGALAGRPALVLVGALGIGLATYARSGAALEPSLEIERDLDDPTPGPGDEVTVTVTVRNAGQHALPDVRIVDGVPDALGASGGAPRFAAPLRPGEAASFSYAVEARRGVHEFDPALAVVRDLPGSREVVGRVPAATTLTCVPPLAPLDVPPALRDRVARYAGTAPTDAGGDGTEFYAVREYRPGDPLGRIDWHRRARTGEFATVAFREERAATVVLVIDARASAYVAPGARAPHAVDRSVDAAGSLFAALLDAGNRVGVAAFAPEDCWLAPGADRTQRTRARELLATHDAFAPTPPDDGGAVAGWTERLLRRRLDADAQAILLSPLVDDGAADLARRLHARGHAVTVVSPDATAARRPGHRLAAVARALRITDLREAGVRVVDWGRDDPLAVALSRATGGWSP